MKRSTYVALAVFLALAGVTIYLNQRESIPEDEEIPASEPIEFLLTESDGLPTRISIEAQDGEKVTVMRNDSGQWVLQHPIEAEANQGSAEAAASQLTSLRIVSRLVVAPDVAGLDPASYTLTIDLTGGSTKTVRIGDLTPTEIGYYASVGNTNEVLILSKDGLDALLVLLESPPYENTPTP